MAFTPGAFGGTFESSSNRMGGNLTGGNTLLYLLMPKPAPPAPAATPVSPTIDPKIEANALYGKPMALFVGGFARIGAGPAPIVGPYFNGDKVDFVVSFGVPANVDGDRKIYKIYLDNELAWSSVGGGTLPGDGTFAAEAFDFVFKPGTLTQSAVSLESTKFPGDECAYRPQMLLEIRNIPFARFMKNTGKPVPYVACDIGDVTDAAVPQDGINLGLALERLAFSPWAGYTSATFDAVNITDVIDAILIKDNFTVVQVCQSIAEEYRNLDVVLSDKVRFRDRGSNVTPDFVFDRDSIIADGAVTVTRGSATAQRREHELIAIDPEQDYTAVPSLSKIPRDPMVISAAVGKDTATLPVVIDASTRQALATFAQNYAENARRRVAFKVPVSGYEIEPGDLFALTSIADGFDNEVFKVIETTHGANWVVEVEGEAILRCSIFGPEGPGTGGIDISALTGSLYPLFAGAVDGESVTANFGATSFAGAVPSGFTSGLTGTTFNPADLIDVTLSGGNLTATAAGVAFFRGGGVRGTNSFSSGKYYWEYTLGTIANAITGVGVCMASAILDEISNNPFDAAVLNAGGSVFVDNAVVVTIGACSPGDVIGVAVDFTARLIWFRIGPSGFWNGNSSAAPG